MRTGNFTVNRLAFEDHCLAVACLRKRAVYRFVDHAAPRKIRVMLQKGSEQLAVHIRLDPVVAVDKADILAFCFGASRIPRRRRAAVFRTDQADIRFSGKAIEDLWRCIRRSVVHDDRLDRDPFGPVCKDGPHRAFNGPFPVEHRDDHRDQLGFFLSRHCRTHLTDCRRSTGNCRSLPHRRNRSSKETDRQAPRRP